MARRTSASPPRRSGCRSRICLLETFRRPRRVRVDRLRVVLPGEADDVVLADVDGAEVGATPRRRSPRTSGRRSGPAGRARTAGGCGCARTQPASSVAVIVWYPSTLVPVRRRRREGLTGQGRRRNTSTVLGIGEREPRPRGVFRRGPPSSWPTRWRSTGSPCASRGMRTCWCRGPARRWARGSGARYVSGSRPRPGWAVVRPVGCRGRAARAGRLVGGLGVTGAEPGVAGHRPAYRSRRITVDGPVVRARLYATAHGIYELFLDGRARRDGRADAGLHGVRVAHAGADLRRHGAAGAR